MTPVTPAIRNLAVRLLALEVGTSEQDQPCAALVVAAKLRGRLSVLVGVAGFEALLARALALARREAGWLQSVHVNADATLEGLDEAARQQSADVGAEGCTALLAHVLALLITFIGEALTLSLVRDVWPEARLDDRESGLAEAPE